MIFDLLADRWRAHWLDPRLVERWTYDPDNAGVWRLACTMGLPDDVEAEVPPPIEQRIALGGRLLDEVRISQSAQGLGNRLIEEPPASCNGTGPFRCREGLGGVLHFCYRETA
ncbi:hypothetical protein ACFL5O_02705 [Myxococcota bacterium]